VSTAEPPGGPTPDVVIPWWYRRAVTVRKISISIDADVLEQVRTCAEADGVSVSAWLVEAARDRARLLGWQRLLDDLAEEQGPPTPEEAAAADAWMAETNRLWEEAVRGSGR